MDVCQALAIYHGLPPAPITASILAPWIVELRPPEGDSGACTPGARRHSADSGWAARIRSPDTVRRPRRARERFRLKEGQRSGAGRRHSSAGGVTVDGYRPGPAEYPSYGCVKPADQDGRPVLLRAGGLRLFGEAWKARAPGFESGITPPINQ
jgi:hypothetical protein